MGDLKSAHSKLLRLIAVFKLIKAALLIAVGLGAFTDVAGHLERIEMGQPFAVIVDFAHTPVACEALFGLLRRTTRGRLAVVFGSAGERDEAKRPMQGP